MRCVVKSLLGNLKNNVDIAQGMLPHLFVNRWNPLQHIHKQLCSMHISTLVAEQTQQIVCVCPQLNGRSTRGNPVNTTDRVSQRRLCDHLLTLHSSDKFEPGPILLHRTGHTLFQGLLSCEKDCLQANMKKMEQTFIGCKDIGLTECSMPQRLVLCILTKNRPGIMRSPLESLHVFSVKPWIQRKPLTLQAPDRRQLFSLPMASKDETSGSRNCHRCCSRCLVSGTSNKWLLVANSY